MAEVNNIVEKIFVTGLSREAFIQKYKELQAENPEMLFSVDLNDETIGAMYDSFHKSDSDVTTEEDIQNLANRDGNDSSISTADLTSLLESTVTTINNQEITNPDDVITVLTNKTILLEQLKSLKISEADFKKKELQSEIDNLIEEQAKNSKELNELKKEYENINKNIQNAEKQKINKEKELKDAKAEINSINEQLIIKRDTKNSEEDNDKAITALEQKLDLYTNTYDRLSNELIAINNNLDNYKSQRKTKLSDIKAHTDDKTKQKIDNAEQKIEEIERQLDIDIKDIDSRIEECQELISDNIINNTFSAASGSNGSIDFNRNNNAMSFDSLSSKGLKYSSEKGQRLARDIAGHQVGFTGYCSRYVNNALERTGLHHGRTASAYQMAGVLANNPNYQEISIDGVDLNQLPAGCILVYDQGAEATVNGVKKRYNAKHGHIEVTLGDGTAVSDGRTHNLRQSQQMRIFVPVEPA